ncbi:hypothetical protein H2198_002231 [Neophaeococcomyces mojaviensis]|uniref:Uncharacterized protein n=1 Tax=Neophaeococcomyces mojaviensis TaxID=3383035 RepID=A0ACC3AFF5_9EURO|nr:hypothetical protein H2198_002231 [Knufia sp. JES_112]
MPLEVYLDPCTVNSRKVLAGLQLTNTPYEVKPVDYFKGEQKSDWYAKINPFKTVPAAVDGDMVLTESNAILAYAADLVGATSAYPQDLKKRANVNRWLLWETSSWFPSCYIYLVEYVVKPLLGAQPDQSVIDKEAPKWNHLAQCLDNQLSQTKWICGDDVTIADIAIAGPMHLHAACKLPLDNYPNLKRWMTEGIEQLPCWKNTQGAVNKALVPGTEPVTNGAAAANATHKEGVKAIFNYTKDVSPQLTEIYFYESEKANGVHEPGDSPHECTVHNGWHRAGEFMVDKNGFALTEFHTSHSAWEDEASTKTNFYPQVVSFLKRELGAKEVLVFDHTIRTAANAQKKLTQETNTSQRAPVMLVHCDYTAESGPVRVRQLLPDRADDLLSRRVAFINVWKPIRNVVEERPLAMCDVESAPQADFFKLYLRYRDRTGENYVMKHSDSHKWWYFPMMTPEQVILLKTYDSETDGRARFVGHSAFEDPTTRDGAPMRESVEIRTICFF